MTSANYVACTLMPARSLRHHGDTGGTPRRRVQECAARASDAEKSAGLAPRAYRVTPSLQAGCKGRQPVHSVFIRGKAGVPRDTTRTAAILDACSVIANNSPTTNAKWRMIMCTDITLGAKWERSALGLADDNSYFEAINTVE